ncbi:HTH-type transcriptional regulator YfmP [Nocardia farcinica]|uniref:MerR family transcriptional regulator n=1 Tax=Nocardia farcinica TaxID=37329 RepID=UPI000BF78935|nr:MerR family transcriptional regulator [Nocardia farcinica]PFW98588.1 HTH-type transcriptional regulator YfmP [Nocardia farcinica]PFX00857.1 HTH-type transcriptional regulator YfmP [Nocardia farcinica]
MTEYRIDDLARAAGTTSRNVRLYQERGLLPQPVRREGRANIYDDSHLARLQIVNGLLERGFTLAHITDFITSWETGKDLSEILGLQKAVTDAWGGRHDPVQLPRDAVVALLADLDAEQAEEKHLDRLADLQLVRTDDDTVTLLRPDLVEVLLELHGDGIDLATMIDLYADLRAKLEDVARTLVVAAKNRIVDDHGPGWLPDTDAETAATTQMLTRWRELGTRIVHSGLEQALDAVLQRELGDYLGAAARQRHSRSDT